MVLDLIRKYIQHGLFNEARHLIEIESDVSFLMQDDETDTSLNDAEGPKLPLLIILSLIKDEENAVNLSRLLLEKGYRLDISDKNGLSAMNYAVALNKLNLVTLYLNLFNIELDEHRDCYKNSFLHYAFAGNNLEIIRKFYDVYSKFYEWSIAKFQKIKNCDGLSLQDLYTYASLKNSKNYTSRTNISNLPECFEKDSNPITICKLINQIYNSNSTIKTDLVFLYNSARILTARSQSSLPKLSAINEKIKENKKQSNNNYFKLNLLYQIRSVIKKKPLNKEKFGDFNEIIERNLLEYRNSRYSPINTNENHAIPRMMSSKINSSNQRGLNIFESGLGSPIISCSVTSLSKFDRNWRTDLKKIYLDYEVINSPSYAKPAITRILQWDGSQSGFYSLDFTRYGSECGSRANSILGCNSHSTLSDFPETNKKLKKNRITNETSTTVSNVLNKNNLPGDKIDNSSKKLKSIKANPILKSIDINEDESNSNRSTFLESSLDKSCKNSLSNKMANIANMVNMAKIVKPTEPTKWSNLNLKNLVSDETSINSHD